MLFNSLEFIILFLPIVFVGYFLLNKTKKYTLSIAWLVVASLFFYSWWNPKYLLLILFSMIFNYLIGILIKKSKPVSHRKSFLILGILGNVGLLGYYKYADFFITNVNSLFNSNIPLLQLILPLAISFFTFQQIAYLVDTYRNETKEYSFATYSLFVTFFPQLIAGPIVHHKEMMPQFASDENKSIKMDNIAKGLFIFLIGLTKKVALADTFAVWANDGFQNYEALTSAEAWITSLSYTFQLYFDFSGYCDMAIGIALLFNIKLPVNFFSPYKSTTIQEFWRYWHTTLSKFLTQYIYIPLGGNRKGENRTYIHIFIIFAISGIWHGAGWTFVIWGILHGLASIVYRAWSKFDIRLPKILAWFITFMFVNATWVYFRSESVAQAHVILKKMIHIEQIDIMQLLSKPLPFPTGKSFSYIWVTLDNPKLVIMFILISLIVVLFTKNSIELLRDFKPNFVSLVWVQLCILFVLGSIFFLHKNSEFLYFNF